MATPAGAGGAGEVSVRISGAAAVSDAAAGGELQQREQTLNSFVRVVAFGEWAGNAFGALAFLWATGVLLGGFCSDLEPLDFWSAMVIIFIEAFRYVCCCLDIHQLIQFHSLFAGPASLLLARRHTCLYIRLFQNRYHSHFLTNQILLTLTKYIFKNINIYGA